MKFEIEQVLFIQSLARTFILAKQFAPSEWALGDDPHLGGVPIQKWTEIPGRRMCMAISALIFLHFYYETMPWHRGSRLDRSLS